MRGLPRRFRHGTVALAAAVLVALSVVPAGSSARAPAWRAHAVAAAGTLQLPPSWVNMTRDRAAARRHVEALAAREPRMRALLLALTARMGPLVKLVAADLALRSVRRGFVTNVSVLAQRSNASLDAWTAQNVRALRRHPLVLEPIRQARVTLTAGPAARLQYVQRVQAGQRPIRVAVLQYAVRHRGSVYLLTYSTSPAQFPGYVATFERSARSLRLR